MNEKVFVATFHRIEPARHLKRRLEEEGIPASLNNQSRVEKFWLMSRPLAAFHTEVHRANYLEARRLVDAWEETDPVLKEIIRCPQCHSSRVEYPQLTRKFILPALMGNFLTAVGVIQRECYCQECHYTWPLEPALAPDEKVPVSGTHP